MTYRYLAHVAHLAAALALAACLTVGAPASPATPTATWNLPGPAPHLLAHYVPWFSITDGPNQTKRTWQHWKYDEKGPHHDPEQRRADGLRDIASVYYPLIGPYNSWSRAVVRYHLATAKAAGIQGLILDWYGRDSYTDRQVPLLLDEAQRLGMRIALCYEEKLNFLWRPQVTSREKAVEEATADLTHLVESYGNHPAYLRRNGLPVVLNFDGWGTGPIGPKMFSPQEFARILAALPMKVSYCREGLVPEYHPALPGAFQWWSSSAAQLRKDGNEARKWINGGKLQYFAGMIAPGFNDTGVWGWGGGPRVTPRAGLSLLKATFDLAFTGDPDLIQIVTWNDFNEGTVVEPTRENGFQYLDALATWWAARTGGHADLDAMRQPFLEYVRICSPAERAELPPAPYTRYLEHRSLAVSVPDYLDVLDRQRKEARAGK